MDTVSTKGWHYHPLTQSYSLPGFPSSGGRQVVVERNLYCTSPAGGPHPHPENRYPGKDAKKRQRRSQGLGQKSWVPEAWQSGPHHSEGLTAACEQPLPTVSSQPEGKQGLQSRNPQPQFHIETPPTWQFLKL